MTGEIGAAGDVATGMIVAHAIDGGETHGHASTPGGTCLNCGTALVGTFCHACGQDRHVHRTLGSIGHDLLHGVFHFEGRIWRTLPMLVRRPGALTRRYIAGERARFVSPLALFLFMVFLMFAAIHAVGGDEVPDLAAATARPGQSAKLRQLDAEIAQDRALLAALNTRTPSADTARQATALRQAIASLQEGRQVVVFANGNALTTHEPHTGWPMLDRGIAHAQANPGLALYKLQESAYKYSWALIPISTPFVALLFLWRRRYTMYDHAIFVTYSLALMMMLAAILGVMLASGLRGGLLGWIVTIVPPVHMFVQLRGAYGLRWFSALWRTIALVVFAWTALTGFALLLLAMGLME